MFTSFILPQFHVVFDDLFETVNCTGIDEPVVKAICQGLFQRERELYADKVLNEAGNIIYQPPPLHEVWLNEAGQWQGNKDRLCQPRWNDNLIRDCNCAVKKVISTPAATDDLEDDDAPNVTQISDDSSVDSLLFSGDSESEGGIWDNTNNDDVPFTPEEIKMLFHPIMKGLGHQWLVHPLIVAIRELIHFQITFLIQVLLLRELNVNVVK